MHDFEAVETRSDNHVGGWVKTTDAAKIWVDVYGRGRPLIFIHGWAMSSAFWKRQLSLAESYQVITIDLRAHGKSPSILRGMNIQRYACDLHEVIHALGIEKALLVGWSMGGMVALEYWKQFNEDKLLGLCLTECTPAPMSKAPWHTQKTYEENETTAQAMMATFSSARETFGKECIHSMFLSGHAPDHAEKWMLSAHLQIETHLASQLFMNYIIQDYTSVLPTISIPTLVLYGGAKNMCCGPSTGQFVAGLIDQSRFTLFEKSGHMPFYEESAYYNHEISNFVSSIR